jgi:hypothetical protein
VPKFLSLLMFLAFPWFLEAAAAKIAANAIIIRNRLSMLSIRQIRRYKPPTTPCLYLASPA